MIGGTMSTINIDQFQSCPANIECNMVYAQLTNDGKYCCLLTAIRAVYYGSGNVSYDTLYILYSTQLCNHISTWQV